MADSPRYFRGLSRNTLLLACTSLFADVSTEMLYPILPVFLTQTLHEAGFRLHVTGGLVSPQPLWWRQVNKGMDMRLYVYGFRP